MSNLKPFKAKKKPVTIEAMQLLPSNINHVLDWIGGLGVTEAGLCKDNRDCFIVIKTLEGEHMASKNDYIIKGVKGEFYPCKPDIFEMTYDIPTTTKQEEN